MSLFRTILILHLLAWTAAGHSGHCSDKDNTELTLNEAVELAIRRSPSLLRIRANGDIAEENRREAASGRLPRVDLGTSASRGNNPVYVFGSLLEQERFTSDRFAIDRLNDPEPVTNVRTTANLLVPLFDSFQSEIGANRADMAREKADRDSEQSQQQLRFEVVGAYYGVILAEAREAVTEDLVKSAESNLKRIRDLSETGMVVRSDLMAAEVQLSEFRQALIEAGGETDVAWARLNTLLGLSVESRPRLLGELRGRRFEVPDAKAAVKTALAHRPELAGADLEVRSARENVRGARGEYLPRLDGYGVYGLSADGPGVDSTDWLLGVRVSYALFDPGRRPRVGRAHAAQSAAEAVRQDVADRIALEAVASVRRLDALQERLEVAAGAVGQAEEVHRIVRDRYEVGLTTITEVLRAESAVLRARLGELTARYGVYLGYAEWLRASGTFASVEEF